MDKVLMKRYVKDKLNTLIRSSLIQEVHDLQEQVKQLQEKSDQRFNIIQEQNDILYSQLEHVQAKTINTNNLVRKDFDEIKFLTRELYKLRKVDEYNLAFNNPQPLITIRIATYNRSKVLMEESVRSILAQTYQNFEVIIVGDHCTDDTEDKVKALNDERFTFYNLPNRTIYPEDRIDKWMVIGAMPMNAAASMAKGQWIAPLDDDDTFTPDHLEKLVNLALKSRCELVYGAMIQENKVTGKTKRVYSNPPEYGSISLNGALYMSLLDELYKYDFHSYLINEVADWTMVRRMMESGVRIASTEDTLGTLNMIPAGHKKKDY